MEKQTNVSLFSPFLSLKSIILKKFFFKEGALYSRTENIRFYSLNRNLLLRCVMAYKGGNSRGSGKGVWGCEEIRKGERDAVCFEMMLLRESSIHLDFGLHY